jgi:hypothetical protein
MNSTGAVMAALILGAAIVVAGFLLGGRYVVTTKLPTGSTLPDINDSLSVYEVDRFTGAVTMRSCLLDKDNSLKCVRLPAADVSWADLDKH